MNLIDQLDQIDRAIFLEMNGWHVDGLDLVMWYISQPWIWIPLYGFVLFLAYKKYGSKGILHILVGAGIIVLLADNIHRECFKEVFERLRPSRNPELEGLVHKITRPNGKIYSGGRFGFISGHAANFTGLTFFICSFLKLEKKWCLLMALWALLICYSRIYLGVHYPGDILGGITLGILVGWLTSFLIKRFFKTPK